MVSLTERKDVLHYPQLDTVLMVEEFIREHSGEFKKKNLWQNLPKKMMYQTFSLIINYLESSGKVAFDNEKKIAWIYNPTLMQKYLDNPQLAAK